MFESFINFSDYYVMTYDFTIIFINYIQSHDALMVFFRHEIKSLHGKELREHSSKLLFYSTEERKSNGLERHKGESMMTHFIHYLVT